MIMQKILSNKIALRLKGETGFFSLRKKKENKSIEAFKAFLSLPSLSHRQITNENIDKIKFFLLFLHLLLISR